MARMTTSSASDSGLQSFAGMFLQVWPSVARIQSTMDAQDYETLLPFVASLRQVEDEAREIDNLVEQIRCCRMLLRDIKEQLMRDGDA